MEFLNRSNYLNSLIQTINTSDIKVITGIRRAGKSVLLEQFIEYVRKNINNSNIIHVNFNSLDFENLNEYHALNSYVMQKYMEDRENFLFIDEVQLCSGFEKVINSLHASQKFRIYITGSNAFLLSSDLATLFTGRTYEIHVFPFSFSEYCAYFKTSDFQKAFDTFALEGGMPGAFLYTDSHSKYNYIAEVFDTLLIRDIMQKYRIKNSLILEKLYDFMLDNISSEVSARSISNTLSSSGEKTNDKTVASYISYLCSAFAFYRVRRYDIRGKKYLLSQDKYYLADHAFRYAKLGTRNLDYGRIYENIVAVELMRRDYEVYTGVLYKKEIDFVALRRGEKLYIQVCDNISGEETLRRETEPLLAIKDGWPKLIIARTRHEPYTLDGIKVIDIADWLCARPENKF